MGDVACGVDVQPGKLVGVPEANRRLAARDGDRANLDGIEPVVLEDTVARQDEPVSTFSFRHSDGDLLAGVLEK